MHWISWDKLTRSKAQGGLGFRDMHSFNLAMLSRQIWRLIQNPESLCAQILKARYFPHTHVLEAVPKDGISYSWRSLLHGLQLFKEGYLWRIGDGTQVRIWSDLWLPRPWSRKIVTPRGTCLLETVSDLVSPITSLWDEQLVRDTFWPVDAATILQIPLREGADDFIAWQFDPKGVHTVRSSYKLHVHLEKMERDGNAGSSTGIPGNLDQCSDDSWKRLWKLSCPRNIQMFAWRIKHESLALRTNLVRRGVQLEDKSCLFCGRAEEDGAHLFVKCKVVKDVWRDLFLEPERMQLEGITSVHVMLDFLWGLAEEKRILILTF